MVDKIRVKPTEEIGEKWGNVTPTRVAYYEAGAVGAGKDWETGALKASMAFKAGISAADIERKFTGGIKKAGSSKYDRKVADVGVSRYPAGVSAAVGDFKEGFAPYQSVLSGMSLSDRKPRGDPANLQRVAEVSKALNAKRLAILGATGGK